MVPRFSSPLTASDPREIAHTVTSSSTIGSSYSTAIRPADVAICANETGISFSTHLGHEANMPSSRSVEKKLLIHTRSQWTANISATQPASSQRDSRIDFFHKAQVHRLAAVAPREHNISIGVILIVKRPQAQGLDVDFGQRQRRQPAEQAGQFARRFDDQVAGGVVATCHVTVEAGRQRRAAGR